MANFMRQFITEKTLGIDVNEDFFSVDGDAGDRIKIIADEVRPHELKKLRAIGKGLRIIVGSGDMRGLCIVWAGDSNSNIGAMHDTVASQFGMNMHSEPHVPLEETPQGVLRVTTTAQSMFDGPREVEDVLDRNKQFRKVFGTGRIDMSRLMEAAKLELDPIEVGDKVLAGKFKNSPRIVTGFKKDKHGQPVLKTNKGDTQLFKPRLTKITNK